MGKAAGAAAAAGGGGDSDGDDSEKRESRMRDKDESDSSSDMESEVEGEEDDDLWNDATTKAEGEEKVFMLRCETSGVTGTRVEDVKGKQTSKVLSVGSERVSRVLPIPVNDSYEALKTLEVIDCLL